MKGDKYVNKISEGLEQENSIEYASIYISICGNLKLKMALLETLGTWKKGIAILAQTVVQRFLGQ